MNVRVQSFSFKMLFVVETFENERNFCVDFLNILLSMYKNEIETEFFQLNDA